MDFAWLWALIGAGVGAYFGGYLKTKGANYATHEDIEKLDDQVKVVTRTTEQIKTEISEDLWNRQKRWELKREALFEAIKRLVECQDALKYLSSTVPHEPMQVLIKEQTKWLQAAANFDKAISLLSIVCKKDTYEAFVQYRHLAYGVAVQIMKNRNDAEAHTKSQNELAAKVSAARAEARKEIGDRRLGSKPGIGRICY